MQRMIAAAVLIDKLLMVSTNRAPNQREPSGSLQFGEPGCIVKSRSIAAR